MTRRILKTASLALVPLIAGAALGFAYGSRPQELSTTVIRENPAGYRFINPVLLFTIGDKSNFPQYKPVQDKIAAFIDAAKQKSLLTDASVYFRNLKDETWMGVNENETYTPSSMLKVGIMMAYFKIKETDPSIMFEKQYYEAKDDPGQYFKPIHLLTTGLHTNEELIQAMIIDSDNEAEQALSDEILKSDRHDAFAQIFLDLHIPLPTVESGPDFLSPKQYSRLFRALYNGAYLPNSFSEEALQLLSNTTFDKGLAKGVPAPTTVAHKFGEHTVYDTSTGAVIERQLHDCGIVYKPNDPYFLCVMTRGKDFRNLQGVISGISDLVYKDVPAAKQ